MKPFPKWFGVLSGIIAIAPTLYAAYQTGGFKAVIIAIIGAAGAITSHSLTGDGGKPSDV
jgi:uncharacterized membrane protein YccC